MSSKHKKLESFKTFKLRICAFILSYYSVVLANEDFILFYVIARELYIVEVYVILKS